MIQDLFIGPRMITSLRFYFSFIKRVLLHCFIKSVAKYIRFRQAFFGFDFPKAVYIIYFTYRSTVPSLPTKRQAVLLFPLLGPFHSTYSKPDIETLYYELSVTVPLETLPLT